MSDHNHDKHDHKEPHKHDHADVSNVSETKLIFIIILNLIITAAEIVGGILSGSLALISDALHNFSDSVSVFISLIALRVSKRPANDQKTFGYKRVEILAAFFNAASLVGISLYLFVEAYDSFMHPTVVDTSIMIPVAIITIVANLISTLLLQKAAKDSLNMRSAYLHMLSDALVAFAVLISAFVMQHYKIYWLDAALTVVIGVLVIKASYGIVKTTINILMQGIPEGINVEDVKKVMYNNPKILDIHKLHIWQLNDKEIHLDSHIQIKENINIAEIDSIRAEINKILEDEFDIHNTVLQIEYTSDEIE